MSALSLDHINYTQSGPLQLSSLSLANQSVLTSDSATAASVSALAIAITGTLTIDATSMIDVSGRGYLGGQQPGNPIDQGRTYGNVPGSTRDAGGSHGGRGRNYIAGISAATLASSIERACGGGAVSGPVPAETAAESSAFRLAP
jgi:hypothetical protein